MAADGQFTPLANALTNADIRTTIENLKRNVRQLTQVATDAANTFSDDFSTEFLLCTTYSQINGTSDMPEQKVQVQYLAHTQKLILPQGLGMQAAEAGPHEATYSEAIHKIYLQVGSRPYADLFNLVNTAGTFAAKRATATAWEQPADLANFPRWKQVDYFTVDNLPPIAQSEETISKVFAMISRLFKLNFDIRDLGALVGAIPNMRLNDNAWQQSDRAPMNRLTSKLQPYTMTCIACLNYAACGNVALGAWIRSFAVCCGVLPSQNTRLTKEWMYSAAGFSDATLQTLSRVHEKQNIQLHALCMNLVAIFGLLHLNKNHTFITGDANMERVGDAYLNTLRTMVDTSVIDEMKGAREVILRTAVHPFGLGQTYYVAKVMDRFGNLTSPLSLRLSVTPPLTQRIMIVRAAVGEWKQMPVGPIMEALFAGQIELIAREFGEIMTSPPSYSELHTLYGVDTMLQVGNDAKEAADSMMPVIFGYAKAFHTEGETHKDGLALAMSFGNVQRDFRAATSAYVALWNKYIEGIEEGGLEKFIESAFRLGRGDFGGVASATAAT